jgi:4-hydroxy-3-methylbut-2-enyl diphosphate reductase
MGQHAGLCFGVRRAVDMARTAAREGPCCTLGPLAHNGWLLAQLEAQGVHAAQTLEDVRGSALILRSHGVSRETFLACEAVCEARGMALINATCPCVERVHTLVESASAQGIPVIIAGQADHPEVVGTAGWACEKAEGSVVVWVVETPEQAAALPPLQKALAVAQTTFPANRYAQIVEALHTRVGELTVEGTICSATAARQAEAEELARWADVMLVVGSRESANTRKLLETCRAHCARSYLAETAEDCPSGLDPSQEAIGITAGASTPEWLFKEVVDRMYDPMNDRIDESATGLAAETPQVDAAPENAAPETAAVPSAAQKKADAEASFMADVEATLVQIRPGQTITGTVVQITDDEVCVNIGFKSDGLVKRSDLVIQEVHVGDEIDVEVVKVNDGEGNVLLSQRNIVNRKNWEILMAQYEAGEYVEGVGKDAVKGGLIANVLGVRAFIPASQLSQRYVERIEDFVGKTLKLKIIEVDKPKKRIVCSRKVVITEESDSRKKEAWSKLVEGEVVTGVVRRLTEFGAFVDVGGVDGLVHVTDLSWGRLRHPSEVVSPGQEISVKILSLDPERDRIQLGYKQTQPRPWDVAEERYPVGSIVEGKVVRITTFGAFVELEPALDGLVHISQCALTRIAKVEDAVQVGQLVRVKVLGVDTAAKRISLSIRAALEDEAFNYSNEIPGDELNDADGSSFSDEEPLGEEVREEE